MGNCEGEQHLQTKKYSTRRRNEKFIPSNIFFENITYKKDILITSEITQGIRANSYKLQMELRGVSQEVLQQTFFVKPCVTITFTFNGIKNRNYISSDMTQKIKFQIKL